MSKFELAIKAERAVKREEKIPQTNVRKARIAKSRKTILSRKGEGWRSTL